MFDEVSICFSWVQEALGSTSCPVLGRLRRVGLERCGALLKICSSALESFDVVLWGCARVAGGSPPDERRNAGQCLLCSPLERGRTVGDQRLFQEGTMFRAGSAVVISLLEEKGPEGTCSPLLEAVLE